MTNDGQLKEREFKMKHLTVSIIVSLLVSAFTMAGISSLSVSASTVQKAMIEQPK